jgi:uncharacterized protein (DUF302 family)
MQPFPDDSGIISVASPYSVTDTLARLETILKAKGNSIFARIDQQREAEQADLTLRPTQLLIFGNPRAGTALMDASPSIALDLPLKALAWQDDHGKVWLSYNSPDYLRQRHHLSDDIIQRIAGVGNLIAEAVKQD